MKPTSTKILYITLALLFCISAAFAQTGSPQAKVSGTLQDTQGKPMDYATVSLLKAKDSTAVTGTLSTEAGTYAFEHVKADTYIIKVTEVGYDAVISNPLQRD